MELYDQVINDPEVYLYRQSAEKHGLDFNKLVADSFLKATEDQVNPVKEEVIEEVAKLVRTAIQECILKKSATKPALTKGGKIRKAIATWLYRIIAGKPVN